MRYWINVDKPTKKCVIHIEGCVYERRKRVTSLKGIGKIKRDGGWLSFQSLKKSRELFQRRVGSSKI